MPATVADYTFIKPFKPHDWQVAPWQDTSPILLLTGSAGGGKSRLAAEKLHALCLKYPDSTGLILRKERAVVNNSTLIFLESEVIGKDPRVQKKTSSFRFDYNNGSILAWSGMKDADQKERIRSFGKKGGIDWVWMEEATQFEEEDYNEVLARMRGTAAPWTQVILTTNPDAPAHWINRRLIQTNDPMVSVYYSGWKDNPTNPAHYEKMLNQLTGVEYQRLVLGRWVAGTGQVIDTWLNEYNPATGDDKGGNVTNRAEYQPGNGYVVWTIDDGYSGKKDKATGMFTQNSHPRAILLCQLRQDGTIAVFEEDFAVKKLASAHIREVLEKSDRMGWETPEFVIRDRAAASLDGVFKEYGLRCRHNTMTVEESVKELRQWVAPDDNGVRRFICHPRCFYLKYQMQTYSMNNDGKIVKDHDDGPDAARYLVWNQAFGVNPMIDIATWSSVEEEAYA